MNRLTREQEQYIGIAIIGVLLGFSAVLAYRVFRKKSNTPCSSDCGKESEQSLQREIEKVSKVQYDKLANAYESLQHERDEFAKECVTMLGLNNEQIALNKSLAEKVKAQNLKIEELESQLDSENHDTNTAEDKIQDTSKSETE